MSGQPPTRHDDNLRRRRHFLLQPLPSCDQLGGACQQRPPDLGSPCSSGELQGDCGDAGIACCVVVPGDDGGSDAPAETLDASPAETLDAPSVGSCNGAPCASGCTCELSGSEAGGGICQCSAEDASSDADPDASLQTGADGESEASSDADAGAEGQADDANESAAPSGDGSNEASVPSDAAAVGATGDAANLDALPDADAAETENSCGVIICGTGCTCVSQAMSACVCP